MSVDIAMYPLEGEVSFSLELLPSTMLPWWRQRYRDVPFYLGMELRCATQQVSCLYATGVEIAGHLLSFTLWLSSDRF